MLNSFKSTAYQSMSQVAKALASPRRLELVDLLLQRPHNVDELAAGTRQPVANASQHLQVLKRARVVETRRIGTSVEYRVVPGVAAAVAALRQLTSERSLELAQARSAFFTDEAITRGELRSRMEAGSVVLVDVRPAAEFEHAHVPGARSIPIDELESRLAELPPGQTIVAMCRGPFCVFAKQAVDVMRGAGLEAFRFEGGVE